MAALQGEGDEDGLDTKTSRKSSSLHGSSEFRSCSLDAVNPFVLLLCGRGGDSVESVVSLDDAAVCLCLAGLDHLIFVVRDEELKAVLGETRTNKAGDLHQLEMSNTQTSFLMTEERIWVKLSKEELDLFLR